MFGVTGVAQHTLALCIVKWFGLNQGRWSAQGFVQDTLDAGVARQMRQTHDLGWRQCNVVVPILLQCGPWLNPHTIRSFVVVVFCSLQFRRLRHKKSGVKAFVAHGRLGGGDPTRPGQHAFGFKFHPQARQHLGKPCALPMQRMSLLYKFWMQDGVGKQHAAFFKGLT